MKNIHFGWILLGVTAFSGFVLSGVGFTFGLFIIPMRADLGWSITTIATAMSIRQIVSGAFQPVSGSLVRRYGPKKVMIFGLTLLGVSTAMMFTVRNVLHYYLQFGIASTLGVTMGAAGPMAAMVSRWFRKRRSLALSVRQSSSSAGQLALTPVVYLILSSFGWRTSYVIMGLVVLLLIVPLSIFLLKDDPAEKGLLPDAERPAPGSPPPQVVKGAWQQARKATSGELNIGWRQAMRTRNFWMLSTGYFSCGFSWSIVMTYLVIYAVEEVGISEGSAAIAQALMGGASVLGIITSGYLGDKIGKKIPLGGIYWGRGLAVVLMMNATNEWQIIVAALVMGFSSFATVPLVQSSVADNYGTISMALISGLILTVHQVGGSISLIIAGRILDSTGTLDPAWMLAAFTLLVGGIGSFLIREKRVPKAKAVPAPAR